MSLGWGMGGCRRKVSLRCVRIAAQSVGDVGTKVGERKLVYERMPPRQVFKCLEWENVCFTGDN